MSTMRAIDTTPSSNRFRAGQGQLDLARRRLLRFLDEDPHDHDAPTHGCHVQRSRNSTATLQPHFPQPALQMLDMRLTHTLQTLFFNQLRDTRQPRPHVFRQGIDLRLDGFVQGLDRPAHILVYQKRYTKLPCGLSSITATRWSRNRPWGGKVPAIFGPSADERAG